MKEAHKELCDKFFTTDRPETTDEVAGIIKTVLDNHSIESLGSLVYYEYASRQ